MLVRFEKKNDGTSVFCCVRADDTSTWQRRQDGFFPFHDLSHYAVETTLGLRLGFLGLLSRGWDIEDFGSPWPRGPLPPESAADASLAECLAGALDGERANSLHLDTEELNAQLATYFSQNGMTFQRPLTSEEFQRVRETARDLWEQWRNLAPGKRMEMTFPDTVG